MIVQPLVMELLLVVVMLAALVLGVASIRFAWTLLRRGRTETPMAPDPEPPAAPAIARWSTLVLVVATFMGAGFGTVYALYGRSLPISWAALAAPAATPPLDLLSLMHRRDAAGDFIVTGLVQNPVTGRAMAGLTVMVDLFDSEGTKVASGTTAIGGTALAPGDQTPFTIRVADAGAVSRYRLGFRLRTGEVVDHTDRRRD